MLTLIIGLTLSTILTILYIIFDKTKKLSWVYNVFGPIVLGLLFAITIIVGVFMPTKGYTEWEEEKRIELVELDGTYLTVSGNSYTFYYEVESEYGSDNSTNCRSETINGDVTLVKDPDIETPYLQILENHGIKSIWSFALTHNEKYVFFVPDGAIKEIPYSD